MLDRKTGWRLEMLGGLRVLQDDRPLPPFSTRKAGALLAYLAFYHQDSHSREYLAEMLWPGDAGPTIRNRLNQTVWALRQNLPAAAEVLLSDRLSLQIHPAVSSDVADFYTTLQHAERATGIAAKKLILQRAIALYRGELLPGYYEDWMQIERQRLADSFLGALRELAALAASEKDWPLALRYSRQAIAAEPLMEDTYLDGIRFALQAGRLAEALRVYRALEQMLRQEYGSAPSEEVRALLAPVWERPYGTSETLVTVAPYTVGPAAEACAWADVRLPSPLTSFFGREAEIERMQDFLRAGRKRLITLLGLGGSGKTRLAIEAARRFAREFPGRIAFIALVDVADAAAIPDVLATALELPRPESGAILEPVIETLRGEPTLLVLDNLEHLPEAAPLLSNLLARVPTLRLLVTSRRKLGLEGEQEIPVLPLPLPAESHLCELLACPSVQMFLDRAQSVRPDFVVTSENAGDVAGLCAALEGIPLAIELCAAWAAALTPAQMRQQLEHRFDLLISRRTDVPNRHRSLWAVIESSVSHLPLDIRRLFTALSIFQGGCTLEAVTELARDLALFAGEDSDRERQVREALAHLLERSLIFSEEDGREMRYRLLESLREFGALQRALEERDPLMRAYVAYFCRLAAQAEPQLRGGKDQLVWMQRLEADYENLRLAMQTCLEMGCIEQGLQLAADLWVFWERTGRLTEAAEWLDRFLTLPELEAVAPSLRVKGLSRRGFFAWRQGDLLKAQAVLEQSYQLAQQLEDLWSMARARQLMGIAANTQGNLTLARAHQEESIALFRSLEDKSLVTLGIYNLGCVALKEGNYEEAASLFQESLESWQEEGFQEAAARALMSLGEVAQNRQEPLKAQQLYLESLGILCACGSHRIVILEGLESLGTVAMDLGREERTVLLFAAVLAHRERIHAVLSVTDQRQTQVILNEAQERLGAETFNCLWAKGQALTFEEAVHEALYPEEVNDDRK